MNHTFQENTGWAKLVNQTPRDGESLSAPVPTFSSMITGILNKLRAKLKALAPVGYQDETGFHYGPQPAPRIKVAARAVLIGAIFSGIIAAAPMTSSAAVRSVTLTWNASTSPNIVGYDIYYGPTAGSYTNMISVGNVTSATITGLSEGTSATFVVKARDAVGLESLPSNEIAYTVPGYVLLAIKTMGMIGNPTSVLITATGATPSQWALESSSDLKTWSTAAEGTNPLVNVSLAVSGTPALFFRLRNE
jgi:hypothetical protein